MRRHIQIHWPACLLLAVVLGGCGTPPARDVGADPTDRPIASPVVTPSATSLTDSPAPTRSAAPQQGSRLRVNAVARVVTNDLVVRSAPGVGGDSEILAERLNAMVDGLPPQPQLLYVIDGPVPADGYDWYLVEPFLSGYCADVCPEPPFGWVAAGSDDGEVWIEPHALDCPEPTVEDIMWLSGVARLACFGTLTLTLGGDAGACFAGERPEASFQEWCYLRPANFVEPEGIDPRGLEVVVALVEWPQEGSNVTVSGQFDHPSAVQCQGMSDEAASEFGIDPATLPPAALATLECRTAFVATGAEPSR